MTLHVSKPDVVIGQLSDEGGLSGGEEEEAASSRSNPSCTSDAVNVLCRCGGRSVLGKTKKVISHVLLADWLDTLCRCLRSEPVYSARFLLPSAVSPLSSRSSFLTDSSSLWRRHRLY